MKKCVLRAAWPVILAGLLFICGCNKSGRLPLQPNAAELCPIKRISFFNGDRRDTITFSYDGLGRPISSMATVLGDGSPEYFFSYDERGRLHDFIGAVGRGQADFWTRYTYSEDNRTIWDTTYTLVNVSSSWPPAPPYADIITHVKKYDREGRVIQITIPIIPIVLPDTIITEYTQNITYDAKGDEEGRQAYDDKINFHRTNKVWMQVDDQYSVHNPLVTGDYYTYNRFGLPSQFGSVGYYGATFLGMVGSNAVIEYECELPKGLAPGE